MDNQLKEVHLYEFSNKTEQELYALLSKGVNILQGTCYTKNLNSQDLNKKALEKFPHFIGTFLNPHEELQLTAVNADPTVIKYISTPTLKVQLAAVEKNPRVILDVSNAYPIAVKKAVMLDPFIISLLNTVSDDIIEEAVRVSSHALQYINITKRNKLAAKLGISILYL